MLEQLYNKYLESEIVLTKHSLKQIDTIMKKVFLAVEIDKMNYQYLKEDPYIKFEDICVSYL
jgi:hypothetical protein